MQSYERELASELAYFEKTTSLIRARLEKAREADVRSRGELFSSTRDMWEGAAHSSHDFDRVAELSQYLEEVNRKAASHLAGATEIQRLERLQDTPYFARIDFNEHGVGETERVYIGRSSLMDEEAHLCVFDWRSPIASIFYRYELGNVQYQAPGGIVRGVVSLKRQYEIKCGKFEYFFDANVQIVDEFLRRLLSKNASSKMTGIVETIQKDQDVIIRDRENELLMVQGVAGSGKTSVALHRVAYLMYQGLSSRLSPGHIVILSPNALFGRYISNVLPELGEEHVETLAFEDICAQVLGAEPAIGQTRNQFFEALITCPSGAERARMKSGMEFKTSHVFIQMLRRLTLRYERRLVPFCDIDYDHRRLFDRHLLREALLKRDARVPAAVRLKQIESMIVRRVREESKARLPKLERFVGRYPQHVYEAQAFARMLSIREQGRLLARIRGFTEIDYAALYRRLFHEKDLFYALARGLALPGDIEEIRQQTDRMLSRKELQYEDALAVSFLKTLLAGCNLYRNIRQVVIDEAQDYYPLHFELLSLLFPKTTYTVLGDVNQTIEKQTSLAFYEDAARILRKKSSALLTLSKSFRCTNQIIAFSRRFLGPSVKQECFSRDGVPPELLSLGSRAELDRLLKGFIGQMTLLNYSSVCILCKSLEESRALYGRVKASTPVALMDDSFVSELSGAFITPIYMAKGLEFDAVLVYDADDVNYCSEDDRKLLYIASTRALHRLAFLYMGRPSRFLMDREQEDTP